MDNVRSIPITVPVPFLPDRTVLFVDGAPGTLSQYIEKQKDEYSDILCDSGYSFLFLPDLVSGLSPEMLSYF
ncbi:MAG: hypothetical protein IKX03_03885, partial [Bacteroidales bacterium]|nr:hypothetical protein [Bacteroidales bacterium]